MIWINLVNGNKTWKMAFHPDKCNVLFITRNKTPIKYTYTLHEHQLEHADKTNYMGVTIQSDLKWDSNINIITTKANKILGFIRRNITSVAPPSRNSYPNL